MVFCLSVGVVSLGLVSLFGCVSKMPAVTPTPTKTPRPIIVRTPLPTAVDPATLNLGG
jgi:hypothetical protein